MTRIAGDWLASPRARVATEMLSEAGFRALFVGGCVRDALLGRAVDDIDVATDARPDRVLALAEAAGLQAVPTGIAHGTVTVVAGGASVEITTFRRDVATDGRRAVVAFADDPAADARRRDFTMNALYAERDGTLVDPLGGLADLRAGRVRFIGRPEDRIREDYLRILRFFRFHAWYGDPTAGLQAEGRAACAALAAGLDTLSRERVGMEMRKLLAAPDPAPSVAAMAGTGVLGRVLPGADDRRLSALVGTEARAGAAPDPVRRLAALGAGDAAAALRLSRAETRRLFLLADRTGTDAPPAALGHALGVEAACDVVLLTAAVAGRAPPARLRPEAERGAAAVFPVAAADLMPAYTGPALGARLAELEARWVASDFRLTRAELLA